MAAIWNAAIARLQILQKRSDFQYCSTIQTLRNSPTRTIKKTVKRKNKGKKTKLVRVYLLGLL